MAIFLRVTTQQNQKTHVQCGENGRCETFEFVSLRGRTVGAVWWRASLRAKKAKKVKRHRRNGARGMCDHSRWRGRQEAPFGSIRSLRSSRDARSPVRVRPKAPSSEKIQRKVDDMSVRIRVLVMFSLNAPAGQLFVEPCDQGECVLPSCVLR